MIKAEVIIYTDGGAQPNPGPGGWGCVLLRYINKERIEKEISGNSNQTTNNRMEITAVIEGLKTLKRPYHVAIYTDSNYVKFAIGQWINGTPRCGKTGWIVDWERRGWARKEGKLQNVDLWQEIWELCSKQKSITLHWVKGHSNDYYNDRCDQLATEERLKIGTQS